MLLRDTTKAWVNGKVYFVLGHKDSVAQRYKFCKLIYKFNVMQWKCQKGFLKPDKLIPMFRWKRRHGKIARKKF
jgi:hypothetical protein